MDRKVLAFDFGASSGRAIIFSYGSEKLKAREISRFPTRSEERGGVLWWDCEAMFSAVDESVKTALKEGIDSVGIDTWGCDFALVDDEKVVLPPLHYRDKNVVGAADRAEKKLPFDRLYAATGIQKLDINTVYRFDVLDKVAPGWRKRGRRALMIADLIAWHLTGKQRCELTNASTTAMLDPRTLEFDRGILSALGLDAGFFAPMIRPGEKYGVIKGTSVPVVAVCTHDTASAVAAVPATNKPFAYISSGTWSLMGTETARPETGADAKRYNFTNEIGYGGSVRLLKNIMGLWILQETRRNFLARGVQTDFAEMALLASQRTSDGIINPDDKIFMTHGDMLGNVDVYLEKTGQKAASDDAERLRIIYDGLALAYRKTIGRLEKITGEKYSALHVVGGGSKDAFLARITADATGKEVLAGPSEATAAGNALAQLIALGEINDLAAARKTVARNSEIARFVPNAADYYDEKFSKFEKLTEDV